MPTPFHEGELAVQARAGVGAAAARIGSGIRDRMPEAAREFLRAQRFAVVGGLDEAGNAWASPVHGPAGFLDPLDGRDLHLGTALAAGDPLADRLRPGSAVGLLVIDFATRRRLRLNGTLQAVAADGMRIRAAEVFANCPKYIQRRVLESPTAVPAGSRHSEGSALSDAQRAWVAAADTCFIATVHPTAGADVSHRGGNPGFVAVVDPRTLRWPDYAGNMMFQTLGNLAVDPRAGLLFVDFARGAALQLSGEARVAWTGDDVARLPGAERLVQFAVRHVVEIDGAVPGGWRFIDASPHNPG